MNAIKNIEPGSTIEVFNVLTQSDNFALQSVVDAFHEGVYELRVLIDTGAILHVPTSQGKDSTVVTLMALEAYRQSIAEGAIESTRPLILSTVDTLGESLPMQFYVRYAKKRVDAYAQSCGIEGFRYDIVSPPLNNQYFVKFVGGQKLIPNSAGRHGDCSIILKVDPSERYVKNLMKELAQSNAQYADAKVITCVGSRSAESSRRSNNMVRQGISGKSIDSLKCEIEEGSLGGYALYKFAPIRDWSTDSVFDALRLAGAKPLHKLPGSKGIPSFFPNMGILLEIYGNGSQETCSISIGSNNSSGCNGKARYGCIFCTMISERDHSSSALAKLERWRSLGAENSLRVRDFLFRLSTSIKSRALHARAFDPVTFNRVALQPNTLKPRHLEKMVRYACQLTIDSQRAAANFKKLVETGRVMDHPGYREIALDPFIPPKTKAAFLEMYQECAQDPSCLNSLFSIEHAILLSFRWSIDGVGGPPFRPLAIWNEISKGKGWIPYPKLNEEMSYKVKLQSDMPLPEAVMMPILKEEDAKHFALNPFNLLDLWRRPSDLSDLFDEEMNCSVTRQADHLADIDVLYRQSFELKSIALSSVCTEFDVVVATPSGSEKAVRIVPLPTEIKSVQLEGKFIRGRAVSILQSSGLLSEIDEQIKAKVAAIGLLNSDSEDVIGAVRAAVEKTTGGLQRIQRKAKHLRKNVMFAGYSDTARKIQAPLNFTKRVTRVNRNKISKGNTRMSFYSMQIDSRLHQAYKQEASLLVPDFSSHTEKFIGTHDADLISDGVLENILVSSKSLHEWTVSGGLERALKMHDDYLQNIIKKRHLRGLKASAVRQYAGTHIAELLLAEGVVSIEKSYWAQLRAILKRTHIFNELGLFQFQSMSVDEVQAHPKAIAMAKHRLDKTEILKHIRGHRNAQRRNVKAGGLSSAITSNLQQFKSVALQSVSSITHGFFADAFKLTFNTSEVSARAKADVSSLWLALNLEEISSVNDVLGLVIPPAQLSSLKADAPRHLQASKECAAMLLDIEQAIRDALFAWSPLLSAVNAIKDQGMVSDGNELNRLKDAVVSHAPAFVSNDNLMSFWKPNQRGLEQYLSNTMKVIQQFCDQLDGISVGISKVAVSGVRTVASKMTLQDKLKLLHKAKMNKQWESANVF